MIPYYVLMGVPLLFAMFHSLSLDRPLRPLPKKNYTAVLFFVMYFLLLALRRQDIGVDTESYVRIFERIKDYSWAQATVATRWEVGFLAFTKFVGLITSSPQVYLAIIAGLCIFPMAYLYFHESEDDVTAIALFFVFPVFIMLFSGLRQSLAMAFSPLIYYTTRKRQLWRSLLLAAVAVLFHKSAVVLFLMYPLYHITLRPKHLYWLIPGFIFTFFNSARLYFLFTPLLGEDYASRYNELTQTSSTTMIILFSLFIAYSFLAPDEKLMDKDTIGLRNILVLVLFIQMFSPVSTITMRMNYYFLPFIPLLVPKISHRITRIDRRYVQLIEIGMVVFFLLYHLLKIHTVDSLNIYPYRFFWQ